MTRARRALLGTAAGIALAGRLFDCQLVLNCR